MLDLTCRGSFCRFLLLLLAWLAVACAPPLPADSAAASPVALVLSPSPSPLPAASLTPTQTASPLPTATPLPSATLAPSQTPTATPTPEPLPVFTSPRLRPGVLPQPYLAEPCVYLQQRWSTSGSAPGTVVVPVMFHSIVKDGRPVNDPKDISIQQFQSFVQYARYLGFETITTAQLIDFLHNNARIPPRSMIMILDDRRPGVVRDHFLPVLEQSNWTLTLAYIADPNSFQWAMLETERLNESGRLDVQSHGYSGQLYIVEQTTDDEIRAEIWNSTPVLAEHFGQTPTAYIWPGGNFSLSAVQIARDGGYQLGFTAYSRGPVMFNWVPQGELERQINDPLLLLPRAWSNSVNVNLDEAVQISAEARQDAILRYPADAAYFSTYCAGELPALEAVLP